MLSDTLYSAITAVALPSLRITTLLPYLPLPCIVAVSVGLAYMGVKRFANSLPQPTLPWTASTTGPSAESTTDLSAESTTDDLKADQVLNYLPWYVRIYL